MSTEFVQRLEALSFVAAERPALRDTDIEWLFSPSHPCSNLLRMVSHALPSLAHVSNEMKASYQTLVAEGRVIKGADLDAAAQNMTPVDTRTLLQLRQRHALLQRQLESEKKSLNQLAFAQQEMEAQLTHSQQSNATLDELETEASADADQTLQRVAASCARWSQSIQATNEAASQLSALYSTTETSNDSIISASTIKSRPDSSFRGAEQVGPFSTPLSTPGSVTKSVQSTVSRKKPAPVVSTPSSSFVSNLVSTLDSYWMSEKKFTDSFDQFLEKQFAPGLTRLLLLQVSDTSDAQSKDCKSSDATDEVTDMSDVSYGALAAEVSRLQSVFVTSQLAYLDAVRKVRAGKAMHQRALTLQREHPRIAGWTYSQLSRHIEQFRSETKSLLGSIEELQKHTLPDLLARLAPLVCAQIVRKDYELKLQRQSYFLSKLELSLAWMQQQQARVLALLSVLQDEQHYVDVALHLLGSVQDSVQQCASVGTSHLFHLQRLQRHLNLAPVTPSLASLNPSSAFSLHSIVPRLVDCWGAAPVGDGAVAVAKQAWSILEDNIHVRQTVMRQQQQQHSQLRQTTISSVREIAARSLQSLMSDCTASTQTVASPYAWTSTALASLIQRFEHESQVQSESYRVLRQEDKERLQSVANLTAEAARTSVPLDYERKMWSDFVIRPADLINTLQKLEQDGRRAR